MIEKNWKPSKETTDKAIIPKLNSALFTSYNYEVDNSILLDEYKIKKYAIGWCYTDETCIPYNTTLHKEIVIMYEVPEKENIATGKYWQHLPLESFIWLFIPSYFEKVVEE